MRTLPWIAVLALAGVSLAQQQDRQTTSYGYDVNGNRVVTGESSDSGTADGSNSSDAHQTINGSSAPQQTVTERVISDGPDGRVVERTIQSYAQTGQPAETERVVVTEQALPGGGTSTKETVYRTDVNGQYQVSEQSVTETTVSGDVTNTTRTVQRPDINGGMQAVERQTTVETARTNGLTREVSVWRPDTMGKMQEQERQSTEVVKNGNQETETTNFFDNKRGAMEQVRQTVTETESQPDGSQTQTVSVYGDAAMGRSISDADPSGLVLREQNRTDRVVGADGSVTESHAVRRASLADADNLGEYQVVSETVCTGDCIDKPAETAEEAPASEEPEQETTPSGATVVPEQPAPDDTGIVILSPQPAAQEASQEPEAPASEDAAEPVPDSPVQ